jgi:uncharacterized repeat protein (TIGR01451 family)
MGKEERWNGTFGRVLRFAFFALLIALPAATASAQQRTSGLALKKVCPASASIGESVTCTIQVENQGTSTVTGLSVTNQVPFPGGQIEGVLGCASTLAASDGTPESGPDYTQCFATEVLDQECPGMQIVVVDQAVASGTDAGTGPVMNSATNAVLVSCTPGEPPPPPESVPAASTVGLALLTLGLVGFGAKRIAKRS